jgi:hypothetical protein
LIESESSCSIIQNKEILDRNSLLKSETLNYILSNEGNEMNKKRFIQALLKQLGVKFSTALGIDLNNSTSEEVFKWFLASILFGARISETIAVKTTKNLREGKCCLRI